MYDVEIMTMIRGVAGRSGLQDNLADPEIMQAVKNNDIATLMSKPEFLKLLDKPSVRNIQEKDK